MFLCKRLADAVHLGIRHGFSAFVAVVAGAAFLSEMPLLVKLHHHGAVAGVGWQVTRTGALDDDFGHYIDAGHVKHAARSHRHADGFDRAIDLRRRSAFHQKEIHLAPVGFRHAVANEPIANARYHGDLLDRASQFHHCRQHIRCRFRAADYLEQAHHIGRTEEVHADHIGRATGCLGKRIDIER